MVNPTNSFVPISSSTPTATPSPPQRLSSSPFSQQSSPPPTISSAPMQVRQVSQRVCQYFLRHGSCSFGSACRNVHASNGQEFTAQSASLESNLRQQIEIRGKTEAELSQAKADYITLQKQERETQAHIIEQNKLIHGLTAQILQLQEQGRQKEATSQAQIQNQTTMIHGLTAQVLQLQQRDAASQGQIHQQNSAIQALNTQIVQLQQREAASQGQIHQQNNTIQAYSAQVAQLQQQVRQKDSIMQVVTEDQNSVIRDLNAQIAKQRSELQQKVQELQALHFNYTKLDAANYLIKRDLSAANALITQQSGIINEFEKQNKTLWNYQVELGRLNKLNVQKEESISKLKAEIELLRNAHAKK